MTATVNSIMAELKKLGSAQTVKIYRNHGADGDMFGVKVGDLKKVLKKIKGDQQLALELWDTNNSDAMYLAGLAADGSLMTKTLLNKWAKTAWWYMLSEYSVPGVASEHASATQIAKKWISSKQPNIASSGWATYSAVLSVRPDDELNLDEIKKLLSQVSDDIHHAPNRVRYCMNNFVMAVGTYVRPLVSQAKSAAATIGKVEVNMGQTSCKVNLASDMIAKVEKMGRVGKKRKTAKC